MNHKMKHRAWFRQESTCIVLFLTRYNESVNHEKNDDLPTWNTCLTRSVYVLRMTSQSIIDDVTNALRDTTTSVNRVREKRYLTCYRYRFYSRPFSRPVVSWGHQQMETFSALLALCAGNSPHKGQWRGALMFSLICAWINAWVNNREAVDLRRHRAHYDVIVM